MLTESMKEVLDLANGGLITTLSVSEQGLHRSYLKKLEAENLIYKVERGIYQKSDTMEDEFLIMQTRYPTGIISHESALYLHGLSDRVPFSITMTFKQGYNSVSLAENNIIIKRVLPKFYAMGICVIKSPCNNDIKVYDKERTLCDLVRGQGYDAQLVIPAMKKYANQKDKNLNNLMHYAEQLRVTNKIRRYMEVLL